MNKVQEFLQERGLTKRASYNQIRKVASLLKMAQDKPYNAADVDTSKEGYHWPLRKDPQIGVYPYSKGGYLRQLKDRVKPMNQDSALQLDSRQYNKNNNRWFPGHAFDNLRFHDSWDAAQSFFPVSSSPFRVLNKAFRESGDIKHKNWLRTGKIGTVQPSKITTKGFQDIYNAATPEQKKKIQHYLNTISQNGGAKNSGQV